MTTIITNKSQHQRSELFHIFNNNVLNNEIFHDIIFTNIAPTAKYFWERESSIDIDDDEKLVYIYIPNYSQQQLSEFFHIFNNNVLNNPIFHYIIEKYNNLRISAPWVWDHGPWDYAPTITCTQESEQFFMTIGRLEGLQSLTFHNLDLPLSLLTNSLLLHQEEEDNNNDISPPPLAHLKEIYFLDVDFIDLTTAAATTTTECIIEDFTSSLKKLPNLECIETDIFRGKVRDQQQEERMKKLACELVKIPFKNGGMVNIDVSSCHPRDGGRGYFTTQTLATPEKMYTEGKGKMTNNGSGGGGTWVFTFFIEVAIAAVQGNSRLEHLEFLNVGYRNTESTEFLTEKAPTFAKALSDPSCNNILDTLVIGVDPFFETVTPTAKCLPVLFEIAKEDILPKLSVHKFEMYGLPLPLFRQSIHDKFSVESLCENHCLEEMNFFLMPTDRYPRYPQRDIPEAVQPFQFSDEHQLYLSLNRVYRQCGTPRNQFNPANVSQQLWVNLFTALGAEDDIKLIYHFGREVAMAWLSSLGAPNTAATPTETDDLVVKNKNATSQLEESPLPPRKKTKVDHDTPSTTTSATTTTTTQQRQPIK